MRGVVVGIGFLLSAMVVLPALAGVSVQGINGEERSNVLAYLNLADLGCDAPPWMVRWRFASAEQEIREALEPLGYYDVSVRSSLSFNSDGDCWQANFDIETGTAVRIVEVELIVQGDLMSDPRVISWHRNVRALEGRRLNHGVYESHKRQLLELAYEQGYFDAAYNLSQVEVDVESNEARIAFHFDSGERYQFGAVEFDSEPLRPELLLAYVPFSEGDPYDARQVGRLRRNLADSGYFRSVQVEASPDQAEGLIIPVRIALTVPDRARSYSIGAGFATDTGPRLRGDTHVRRHNDRGHRSDARLFLSQIQQSVEGTYQIPRENPLNNWYTIDAGLGQERTDTATSQLVRFGFRHTFERRQWVESNFVDVRLENFDVASESGFSRLIILGKNWNRVWGDSGARPLNGFRLGFEVRGAAEYLASDTNFVQGRLNAKWVQQLWGEHRLIFRSEAGGTWRDELTDLPASVRFFAGGDNSVRGYGFKSLGPVRTVDDGVGTDPLDPMPAPTEITGGAHLFTGTVELDFKILDNWSFAVFADSGSAFNHDPEFSTGVGAGIRWYSPIGPLRIDLAHPLDDPGRAVRLHISLGPDL